MPLLFPSFSENQKASWRLDPKTDLLSPDLHHHDSYLVPNENFYRLPSGSKLTWWLSCGGAAPHVG